jgi:glycerol-3-phosphate dehydrogenase subunit B
VADPDVLVLGGGLGAVVAALSAAEEAAAVQQVVPRTHPFDAHTGLVDVLGHPEPGDGPTPDPLEALAALPASHPYRRIGREALERGLALFDRATAGTHAGAHSATNALVPTCLGTARPAIRYPETVAPGLLSRTGSMTLVGFDHFTDFDPFYAAAGLERAGVPFDVDAVQVPVALDPGDDAPALAFAEAFDADADVDGMAIRQSVVRSIRRQRGDADRIGFPAVLGLESAAAVRAELDALLEGDVFELPLGPPSVLGRRLRSTLLDAVEDAGVTLLRGWDVDAVETVGGRIDRVTIESADCSRTSSPESVVLATGGPAAGGIVADRSGVREPRFGCYVPHPDDRRAWTEPSSLGSHELATFGLEVDGSSRPLTAAGEPAFENCYAAGRIVGGHDFVAQHAVAGVGLATGAAGGLAAATRDG